MVVINDLVVLRKVICSTLYGCGLMTRRHLLEILELRYNREEVDVVIDALAEEKLICVLMEGITLWYASRAWMEERR